MQYVTDLHLHSKYSRAVSPQMNLSVMAKFARQKGLDILTAADFTHPVWFKEIAEQLQESEEGIYHIAEDKKTRFLLTTEISSIYKEKEKLRRIHSLLFVPSLEVAQKVTKALVAQGCNLNADGRPIVGLSVKHLFELILSIDSSTFLIPCHVWTPHFGVYGSASGFDSLEEAFGELAGQVYGIETGISSDPGMNWAIAELKNRSILSFSDAHSPAKMGREATVMELEAPTYENIKKAIMSPAVIASDPPSGGERGNLTNHEIASPACRQAGLQALRNDANKIAYTIEFYPEEGKYHFSGHRNCKFAAGPAEIRESGNVCPVCQRKLTEGVLYRVQELTDASLENRVTQSTDSAGVKWYTDNKGKQPPYVKLVPLLEIAAESLGMSVNSQKAKDLYTKLCLELGSELAVLLTSPLQAIEHVGGVLLASGVRKVREGAISIEPGFDGEYGKVTIWHDKEEKAASGPQMKLF